MDFVLIDLVHMERAHLVTSKNMNANGFNLGRKFLPFLHFFYV
jgi:hypothetical protein